jgi:hypothetical protein
MTQYLRLRLSTETTFAGIRVICNSSALDLSADESPGQNFGHGDASKDVRCEQNESRTLGYLITYSQAEVSGSSLKVQTGIAAPTQETSFSRFPFRNR